MYGLENENLQRLSDSFKIISIEESRAGIRISVIQTPEQVLSALYFLAFYECKYANNCYLLYPRTKKKKLVQHDNDFVIFPINIRSCLNHLLVLDNGKINASAR